MCGVVGVAYLENVCDEIRELFVVLDFVSVVLDLLVHFVPLVVQTRSLTLHNLSTGYHRASAHST